MSVYLDVPFVSQLNYGGGMNDPTGCWYCSCQMLAYFFEAGPRLGVPEIYSAAGGGHAATGSAEAASRLAAANPGGTKNEHQLLAEREGLAAVAKCDTAYNFSLKEIEMLLRKNGPVFFYWQKTHGGSTYGHASVIIGTDDKTSAIIYHDPENAPNSRMALTKFNSARQSWQYAMMQRKNVAAYGRSGLNALLFGKFG